MDEVAQAWVARTGPAQTLATHDREPDLHLIEPRTMRRPLVGRDLGPLRGAPVLHRLFLMKARIVDNQMPATVGVAAA